MFLAFRQKKNSVPMPAVREQRRVVLFSSESVGRSFSARIDCMSQFGHNQYFPPCGVVYMECESGDFVSCLERPASRLYTRSSPSSSLPLSAFLSSSSSPSWGKRKPEEAPQEQGRRAVRQAVADGRSDRDVTRRLVDVLATLSLVNAPELRELTATVFKTYLVQARRACPKQWQRRVESTTNPLTQSRASPKPSAYGTVERSRARKSRARKAGRVSCSAWTR